MPRWIAAGVLFWLFAAAPLAAQTGEMPVTPLTPPVIDTVHARAIDKLLTTMEFGALSERMMSPMLEELREQTPGPSDEVWDLVVAELRAEFTAERQRAYYTPIFAKYYTLQEIQDLQAFFESPTGRRYTELAPRIALEGLNIGLKINERVKERALQIIRTEHGITPSPKR